jgi:hypothetical protein
MAVRVLKKTNRRERRITCVRCGKVLIFEIGDIVQGDDGLCYVICANLKCRKSNYVGTSDVRPKGRTL